ncbi:MAG: PleD family two-component system response regulator [Leptolyngbyaceae cyanobacterium bins.302]|nr:PleD family two-component system response regulator [Leptolyngbyaceae cyanobacterium bins.302]
MTKASSTNTQGKILVVDDAPENLDLLYRILSRKGFQVTAADGGKKALELVRAQQPELILLDVCMPEMDGYAICECLKNNPTTKDIPIIFVSALDEVVDKVKAFEVGAVDYIAKPYHAAEVIVRVTNHLTLRRLHQQLEIQNDRLRQEICDRLAVEVALQTANKELERLAHMDGLTQVANRRSFDTCLAQEWRRMAREQNPLTLILCDVDYFKRYNDTYGHQAGDDCLRNVAKAVSNVLKRPSDLVARYGGEEFAIILPNTPLAGAVHVAAEIRSAIQSLEMLHSASLVSRFVTLSMGISTVIPLVESSPMGLLAAADRALYKAKLGGRDRVCAEEVYFQMEGAPVPIAESEI